MAERDSVESNHQRSGNTDRHTGTRSFVYLSSLKHGLSRFPAYLGVAIGAIFGALVVWWVFVPSPQWIEFNKIYASYEVGTLVINIHGQYEINNTCKPEEIEGPPVWEVKVLPTDGQIALYGTAPDTPKLDVGVHPYVDHVNLTEPVNPDGWRLFITARCPGKTPETVSSKGIVVETYDLGLP